VNAPADPSGRFAGPGDARFFHRTGPYVLAQLAEAAGPGCTVTGALDLPLHGVAPLQSAGPGEVSFLDNKRYLPQLGETRAGVVIVHPDYVARVPAGTAAIATTEPYLVWARIAGLFYPVPPAKPGIHPSAVIDPAAVIDPTAEIGPLCVIEAGVVIGARCRIAPGSVIGAGVSMGTDCRVGANASISHAMIGNRVYVYAGARVGQDGFGFAPGPAGFVTVPQLGRVILEDDVELGANSTIDRGSTQDSVIGAGSRIDNLVQLGHNVHFGRCCVVVAQAGVSGSTILEDFVVVAAQAGLTGHLRIGAKARIGAQAGVMRDVPAGSEVVGSPALPVREFFRNVAVLRKLAQRRTAEPG
jgi:UDP-3-O-[3-hydroxymyristoyl] glucosamine N-acyltransferase